jgi:hypothetical protein
MIPVTDNKLKPQMNERDKKVVREIEDFAESDCKLAYVWSDETVSLGRNVDIYKRAIRRLRKFNINVKQKNKQIMLKKNDNEEETPTVDYKLGFDSGYNRALTKVQELLQSGKTDSEIINELISMCGIEENIK